MYVFYMYVQMYVFYSKTKLFLKDRQQEAEQHSSRPTLLSSYLLPARPPSLTYLTLGVMLEPYARDVV